MRAIDERPGTGRRRCRCTNPPWGAPSNMPLKRPGPLYSARPPRLWENRPNHDPTSRPPGRLTAIPGRAREAALGAPRPGPLDPESVVRSVSAEWRRPFVGLSVTSRHLLVRRKCLKTRKLRIPWYRFRLAPTPPAVAPRQADTLPIPCRSLHLRSASGMILGSPHDLGSP